MLLDWAIFRELVRFEVTENCSDTKVHDYSRIWKFEIFSIFLKFVQKITILLVKNLATLFISVFAIQY